MNAQDLAKRPHRWLETYPELGSGPISTEPYISPEWYEREKEKIFSKVWLCVGRTNELPKVGDYKVKRLEAANTSAIIIRGKDGEIRAFHNMCAHRGNTVVTETGQETYGSSKAAVLACRFHGWVYGADGALKGVPAEDQFYPCFEKDRNGMKPIQVGVWEGFIFVNVAEKPDATLEEFLGDYAAHFSGYPFDALDFGFTYRTEVECNWKVAHDAFAEAYHVATIHAGSFGNVPSCTLEHVKLLGPHRTSAICLTVSSQTLVGEIANAMVDASVVGKRSTSILPATVNPEGRTDFSFELSVLFPNTLLHVGEGFWFTHQFWPLAHDRTLWEGRYYVQAPTTNSQRWATEHAIVLQRNAWLEDTATMEATQRAMSSRAKLIQHLQDDEILIRHGARVVEQYVNA